MKRNWFKLLVCLLICIGFTAGSSSTGIGQNSLQLIAGRNINMISGITLPEGDPHLQRQDEVIGAFSSRNPMHGLFGANDYRTVDLPGLPDDRVTGDAWLSLFKTFDGGLTWKSTLLPGYPQDTSPEGLASPLLGFEAAADPGIWAAHNGLFYYSGIAFDREESGLGVIFVSRFIDLNNVEGISAANTSAASAEGTAIVEDSIKAFGTSIIDDGTPGQFIDKPWGAADIPRPGAQTVSFDVPDPNAPGGFVNQEFACGNVYLTYAEFLGETKKNVRNRTMLVRSTDCGSTWDKPIKLDESYRVGSGTVVAIAPNGDVYVAWRLFAANDPDAIMIAKSTDGGRRFTKPIEVAQINAGDQPTLPTAGAEHLRGFRTNAFPAMAIDGNGRVYVAWAEKIGGYTKIVVTSSADGHSWASPEQIEPNVDTYQVMPSFTSYGGKLSLLYYDFRDDVLASSPGSYPGGLIADTISLEPFGVRHTVDVRAAQADPGPNPQFSSIRVSQYFSVIDEVVDNPDPQGPAKVPIWRQLRFNQPNLPLFAQGTRPFMGDYIQLAPALPILPKSDGTWEFNYTEPTDLHAAWTDNRNVDPPGDLDWTRYFPAGTAACGPDTAGMRNQDLYTSRLTEGLVVGTMGNSKYLSMDKYSTFVVFAQNLTNQTKDYALNLTQPTGGIATFSETDPSQSTLMVEGIFPYAGFARTVFVKSSNSRDSLEMTVSEMASPTGALTRKVTLNPDATNPPLVHVLNGDETHTPVFEPPPIPQVFEWPPLLIEDPADPTKTILNPEYLNPEMLNPEMLNPEMLNPEMLNPEMLNPEMLNPEMLNPEMLNPEMLNPEMLNPEMLNPEMLNPEMLNPEMLNVGITDITWTMRNDGNVDSAFRFAPIGRQELAARGEKGLKAQLFIYRPYKTPYSNNCQLEGEGANFEFLVNVANPEMLNPEMLNPEMLNPEMLNQLISDNQSFRAVRGEKIFIKLRLWNTADSGETGSSTESMSAESEGESNGETPEQTEIDPNTFASLVAAQATNSGEAEPRTTPFVITQPVSQTVCSGLPVSFTATAGGFPVPTIQWQVSTDGGVFWQDIVDETSETLTFVALHSDEGNQYRALLANESGDATSIAAALTVNVAPTITTEPADQTVCESENVTFTAAATGYPNPTIQWQVRIGEGGTWTNISGATSGTLMFNPVAGENGNQYRALFTNDCAGIPSAVATLTVNVAPDVTTEPMDATVCEGVEVTFAAVATGRPDPAVQWQVRGEGGTWTPISGATAGTLAFIPVAAENGNQYRAVFSNSCGTDMSEAATLTVHTPPVVTEEPESQEVCAGDMVTLQATAEGFPTPTVQWQRSVDGGTFWAPIDGAASTTLSFSATAWDDDSQYRAVFENTCGTATSSVATVDVNVAPTVTTHPVDVAIFVGGTASFTAAADGMPAPTLQWQVSTDGGSTWDDIAGSTSGTYTVTNAGATMNGNRYRALFTNTCASVASASATLSVTYNFSGFNSPLGPANDLTVIYGPVNVSSNQTVKWRLADAQGNYVTDLSAVSLMAADRDGERVVLYSPSSNTTGNTELRAGEGQYVFNWDVTQMPAPIPGVYTLVLTLNDGESYRINIEVR